MEYLLLKIFNVSTGVIFLPLAMYIGFCFGRGEKKKGWIGVGIQIVLTVADTIVYWRMMEILPH
jgi:hypothetical protein